jgi:hypothetical protein
LAVKVWMSTVVAPIQAPPTTEAIRPVSYSTDTAPSPTRVRSAVLPEECTEWTPPAATMRGRLSVMSPEAMVSSAALRLIEARMIELAGADGATGELLAVPVTFSIAQVFVAPL